MAKYHLSMIYWFTSFQVRGRLCQGHFWLSKLNEVFFCQWSTGGGNGLSDYERTHKVKSTRICEELLMLLRSAQVLQFQPWALEPLQCHSWTLKTALPAQAPSLASVWFVPYFCPLCYNGLYSAPKKVQSFVDALTTFPNFFFPLINFISKLPRKFSDLHDSRTDLIWTV